MKKHGAFAAAALLLFLPFSAWSQTNRIASDFEIEQMEKQAASAHDFVSQIAAHMNLGDLRKTRGEAMLSVSEYRIAADTAARERTAARKASNLERYATATVYAGLAAARLGEPEKAFALAEEAIRYASDDARIWNVYSAAMRESWQRQKAVSAARNALAIQTREVEKSPSMGGRLDLVMYQTSLAMALKDGGETEEAQKLFESAVASLRGPDFEPLRKDAARRESFEIYSTVTGDTAAYLSLLNRSQLQLADIYEQTHNVSAAKRVYRDVLQSRNDDPAALAALAKLATTDAERSQIYADAFDANPFSLELIDDYRDWLERHQVAPNDGTTSGAQMRRALELMARNENRAARATLDALIQKFPSNDVVQYLAALNDEALGDIATARMRTIRLPELREEIDGLLAVRTMTAPSFLNGKTTAIEPSADDLKALVVLLAQQRLTPEQRGALDRITFTSTATFDATDIARPGQTVFETGSIGSNRFRFSEPTAFNGSLPANAPLKMSFHVLGATEVDGGDALLVEPLKLEVIR